MGRKSTSRARLGRLIAGIAASFAAVTCDLVTAPVRGAGSGITVNYTGQDTLVVGTKVPFSVQVLQGTVPIEGAEVRLKTSDSAIIQVVDVAVGTDTIIVKKRGHATIRGTLIGVTGDQPPFADVVIVGVAASVTVDSTSVTFRNIGDTVRLRANVFDTNGVLIDSVARWRSLNNSIASIDSITGKLLARASGTTQIRAIVDLDTATLQVSVVQNLVRYLYSTPTLTINSLNQDTVITVRPQDAGGSFIPHNTAGLPVPTFTSKNTGVATVTTLTDSTFRVSSLANDTTRVRIVAGTLDTTLFVSVGQLATSVVIQGATADTIDALQDTVRLRGRAFDARTNEVQGRSVIWTSLNTTVVTVDANGLVTGQTLGTALVTARLDAALDTVPVTVQNNPRSITTPASISLPTVGDSVIIGRTVLNKLGAPLVGAAIAWRALDTTIATVGAASGLLVARSIGNTAVIGAIAGGGADTTLISVANNIATLQITQPDTTLASIGDTSTVRIDFRNARGAALAHASAFWSSSDSTTLIVANGFVTALRQGFADIQATDPLNPARFDLVRITVSNAPAVLALNRVLDTLTAPSRTLQYVADVRNTRGALLPGALTTFRTTNGSIASVTTSGLATALAVGTTSVIAEVGSGAGLRADTATLVVTNDAVGLTVSPTDITIASIGATTALVADARNAVGGLVTGVTFIWTSSDPAVASVSGAGVVTGVSIGTAVVTTKLAALTATANITVTNAPDTVNIVPTSITMASVSDSLAPAVILKNALGAALPRTSAQWVSDDAGIATVASDGTIIAAGRGTTRVRARNATNTARQDSVSVTVTDHPDSINVVRTVDVLPSLNRTIQYTADVFNTRRRALLTEPVTWTVRNPTVATIASSGLATSVGIGQSYIVGSAGITGVGAGVIADSALLIVSNTAASVGISPATVSLVSLGETAQLTATARNELGNVIAGPIVTWATSNAAVALVDATGLVTAAGIGSATVNATVDAITTGVAVTVTNPPSTVQITSGTLTLASIGDQVTPSVNFTNSLGAALPSSAVTWTTSDVNVFTVTSLGVVTATGAGTATLTATSPANGAVTSAVTVIVTNAPATLAISPSGTTTLTSIGQTATLTATIRNAAGAVVAAPNPAATWSSSASGFVSVNPATGVVTAVAPGSATITATAGAATSGVTVTTAPVASASRSTIVSGAASITANGVATTTITVQLKDAGGTNLTTSGGAVTMSLTGTGALGAVSNSNSTYTATLTAPTALGNTSVSATINGAAITTGNPLVSYVAGPAIKYLVTSSGLSPVAGTAVTISAQLADFFNNPVTTARTVTWSSTAGGSFASPTSATNASGIATIGFTTDTTAATSHLVSATDNVAVTGTSAAIVTIAAAGPASAAQSFAIVPTGVAGSVTTITVQTRDAAGNNRITSGGTVAAVITGPNAATGSVLDNNNGTYTITYSPAAAGSDAIAITLNGTAIGGSPYASVVTPGTLAGFLVEAAGGGAISTQTAGVSFNVRITARDANGNTVSSFSGAGNTVTLTSSGTLTGTPITTGNFSTGVLASQAVTITNTGAFTLTATRTSGVQNGQSTVTVQAGAAVAAQTTAVVPAGTAGAATTITVQAKDAFGNNRTTTSGTVTASVTGANSGAGMAVVNNNDGTYTATYTPTLTGTDFVAVLLGGSPISGSPFTSVVSPGALHHFAVTNTSNGLVGGQTAGTGFTVRARAQDASNNTVTSFTGTVVLTSSGTLTGAPITTASFVAGQLSTQAVTITSAGSVTITATNSAISAETGTSNSFTVAAGALHHFLVEENGGGNISAKTAGTTFNIQVTAQDVNNNTVTLFSGSGGSGNKVNLTSTGTLTGAPILTGNFVNGVLLNQPVTITNTGTFTITATRAGGTETGTSVVPFAVSAGALHHFAVTSASPLGSPITTKTANSPFDPPVVVTAQDANNNTVTSFTGVGSTVTISSTGTLTVGSGTTATFVAGVLPSLAVTISNTGLFTITATRTSGGTQTGTSNTFAVN